MQFRYKNTVPTDIITINGQQANDETVVWTNGNGTWSLAHLLTYSLMNIHICRVGLPVRFSQKIKAKETKVSKQPWKKEKSYLNEITRIPRQNWRRTQQQRDLKKRYILAAQCDSVL